MLNNLSAVARQSGPQVAERSRTGLARQQDLEQLPPASRSNGTESVTVEQEIAVNLTFNPLSQCQDLPCGIGLALGAVLDETAKFRDN